MLSDRAELRETTSGTAVATGAQQALEAAAAQAKHIGDVGLLEKQLAGQLVVFLVECAAGDEKLDGLRMHGALVCHYTAL